MPLQRTPYAAIMHKKYVCVDAALPLDYKDSEVSGNCRTIVCYGVAVFFIVYLRSES